jgi:streptogramin lyase
VYVDNKDSLAVRFWSNATLRFDPKTEPFTAFKSKSRNASVRQMLGRPGEVWLPESGADMNVEWGLPHQTNQEGTPKAPVPTKRPETGVI